jgi:hypothetical protein
MEKAKGFFEEAPSQKSFTRLASFLSLLFAFVQSGTFLTLLPQILENGIDPSALATIITWLTLPWIGAFAPKVFQKFKEEPITPELK